MCTQHVTSATSLHATLNCMCLSEGRIASGGGNADDSATAAGGGVAAAAADNDNEEDGPPPALPPRPPNLALPAQSAMSTCPTATSSITPSSAAAASQHPPHIGNSYSRRLEETATNRAGISRFLRALTVFSGFLTKNELFRFFPLLRGPLTDKCALCGTHSNSLYSTRCLASPSGRPAGETKCISSLRGMPGLTLKLAAAMGVELGTAP